MLSPQPTFNRVRNFPRKKIRRTKIGRTEFSPQLGTNRIRVHFCVYSVSGHVTISLIIRTFTVFLPVCSIHSRVHSFLVGVRVQCAATIFIVFNTFY